MKRLLTAQAFFLLAVSIGVVSAQETKKNKLIVPISKQEDKNWMERHNKLQKMARKGDVDLLFLGDSLTERWANNSVWKKSFAPLKAANFGIGGDRIEHLLWRVTEGKELEGIAPRVAVLLIGANNFSSTPEHIVEGVQTIVGALRKTRPGTKILVLGLFPRGPRQPAGDPNKTLPEQQAKTRTINESLAKIANGENVFFMDIGNKFLDEDGKLSRENMPDFLHLSPKGYAIWAEAIEGKVKELLN